jgi:uncharacterized protein HemY
VKSKLADASVPTAGETKYNLGFTAASLRPELARIVAECYLAVGNWDLAKDTILSSNKLQSRSAGSLVRMERELVTAIFDELRNTAEAAIDREVAKLPKDFPAEVAESIVSGMKRRLRTI